MILSMWKIIDLFAKQPHYFHFMGNMKDFNWLYQGHWEMNDKKPENGFFLLPNILKYLAHVKKKLMCDERTLLGMKKRSLSLNA